ncbi:MAG: glycosyltransferase family 4 protein [Putridiphycobacter sp.]
MALKIAFCTDGIFPEKVGGMQRHSRLLIEELVKNKTVNLTVFHPHNKSLFKSQDNLKEVVIEEINFDKNYLKECKLYSKRMYEALQSDTFDIIYSQGLSVWYKAEEFSDKLIVNPHGLEPYQAIGLKDKLVSIVFKKVFNHIFSQAKFVISLGGKLTEILKANTDPNKIIVLPNATNIPATEHQKRFPKSGEPVQFLFVSRFAKNKGIHILMDVIAALNQLGYQDRLFFHLAGKGPLYENYSTNFQFNNVKYWGFISDEDLEQLYKDVDAFVFPTLFEGMPTVVLEAMANKLPIIISDVGATAEQVDETNGYLIERNKPEALKTAILDFFQLACTQKEQLSKHSYQKVKQNFTWEVVAQKHLELFEQIKSNN